MLFADFFSEIAGATGSVAKFISDGGVFMYCLVALSVLSVSLIVFKGLVLRGEQVTPVAAQEALADAEHYIAAGEKAQLAEVLHSNPSALSRIGGNMIAAEHLDRHEAASAAEANAREEVVNLETGIPMMEVVITIAPLLGLLGTVAGLVGVFSNLNVGGSPGSHAEVARGIAEALNTTIAGLAVAVPTVVAHSYFVKKLERLGVRMEVLTDGLLSAIYRRAPREGTLPPRPAPASSETAPGALADVPAPRRAAQ